MPRAPVASLWPEITMMKALLLLAAVGEQRERRPVLLRAPLPCQVICMPQHISRALLDRSTAPMQHLGRRQLPPPPPRLPTSLSAAATASWWMASACATTRGQNRAEAAGRGQSAASLCLHRRTTPPPRRAPIWCSHARSRAATRCSQAPGTVMPCGWPSSEWWGRDRCGEHGCTAQRCLCSPACLPARLPCRPHLPAAAQLSCHCHGLPLSLPRSDSAWYYLAVLVNRTSSDERGDPDLCVP